MRASLYLASMNVMIRVLRSSCGMITAMESDMDHQSVAWLMVWWYGDDAGPQAALVRDWSLKLGDLPKHEDYKKVVNAIVQLQTKLPPEDDASH
jgi:hypothetical protein